MKTIIGHKQVKSAVPDKKVLRDEAYKAFHKFSASMLLLSTELGNEKLEKEALKVHKVAQKVLLDLSNELKARL